MNPSAVTTPADAIGFALYHPLTSPNPAALGKNNSPGAKSPWEYGFAKSVRILGFSDPDEVVFVMKSIHKVHIGTRS